jgi:glycosyltransferase involved in cell wall biosynthesis
LIHLLPGGGEAIRDEVSNRPVGPQQVAVNELPVRAALGASSDDAREGPPTLDRHMVIATLLRGGGATGVETHVREVLACGSTLGASPLLITPFSYARPLAIPIFGVRLGLDPLSGEWSVAWYRYWHEVFLRRALSKNLAKDPSAVVYAQCPVAARAALQARTGPHQRVVMAVHFNTSQADEWVDKGRIRRHGAVYRAIRRLERDVIPAADGLLYVSQSAQEALESWLPEARRIPARVVPNFLAAPTAPLASVADEVSRDVVSVGSLETAKNHVFLLDVLAEANRLGFRYRLDIVGEGPCRSGLTRRIGELGLEGQVRLLGYRSDVRALLRNYRAYVHASVREAMAIAPIEALAAGLPVLAVPTGGLPEIVDPGVEGLFWSAADPVSAARKMVDLLEDGPLLNRMARAARARFDRELAADVVGPQVVRFVLGESEPALDDTGGSRWAG